MKYVLVNAVFEEEFDFFFVIFSEKLMLLTDLHMSHVSTELVTASIFNHFYSKQKIKKIEK